MINWISDHIGEIVGVIFIFGIVSAAIDGWNGDSCYTDFDYRGPDHTYCE